ncbi:MAG: Gfo/Idh/MocA family oxidoreductase [Armatimonadetes bacterium]|nr:Gfo/Idh/MocA family oxidoreductase [Armatimonadota bacterium]CUU37586.1 Predicted dehydrogenase [Armatimonadetes bacterium DC]
MSVKLCVAGLTHGHVWGLIDTWADQPEVELTAVADSTPLLEKARARFQRAYDDWRMMLQTEQPDIVLACADNRTSAQIAIAGLEAGAHVMVEKPMAADLTDAQAMWETAQRTGRLLMINWPTRWNPAYQALFRRARAGEFGQIFEFRFRIGHAGPREIGCDPYFVEWLYDEHLNGGGALIDFGGYGAVMAIDLLGMPESVLATRGNFTKPYAISDDHAVLVLRYPRAVAVLEATWAQMGTDGAPNPIIYGTEATAGVLDGKLRIHRRGESPVMEEPEPLPVGERNPAEYFLRCIRENRAPEGVLSPEVSLQAQAVLERAKLTT